MKMPEMPEVELPKLPPMGYGNEGYSALKMQEYAVEYAEKLALAYGQMVREACAKVCEDHASDAWDHEGGALWCADSIRQED